MTVHKMINGTCMSMKEIEDGSIDFVFTSPPYFNVKLYSGEEGCIGEENNYNKYMWMIRKVFKNCYDKLKQGSYMIINIAEVISNGKRYPIPWHYFTICESIGFTPRGCIMWKKPDGITSSKRFGVLMQNPYVTYYYPNNVYEFNMMFTKGKVRHIDKKDMYKVDINKAKPFQTDIWELQPDTNNPHPAPFPVKLAKNMIYLFCPKEGTVLEPFSGSGTTIMASRDLHRNSFGYEINKEYFEYIKKRVGFHSGFKRGDHVVDLGGNEYYVIKQDKTNIKPFDKNINYIYDYSGHREIKKTQSFFKGAKKDLTKYIKENKYMVKKCLNCSTVFIIDAPGKIWNYREEQYEDFIDYCPYCEQRLFIDKKEHLERFKDYQKTKMTKLDDTDEGIVNLARKVEKKETFDIELK